MLNQRISQFEVKLKELKGGNAPESESSVTSEVEKLDKEE